MSISRKGRRRIVVDDREYAWLIRRKPTVFETEYDAPMRVAVQSCDEGARSVLVVRLGVSRPDTWAGHQTGITPATIAYIVRCALAAGWNPSGTTSPFNFDYRVIRESIGFLARAAQPRRS